ncbi:MAG: chemotaxis response regulator protein-glutamate methylesterase [Archangium sp.]
MTSRPRVLIVDDSVVVRRMLSTFIEQDPGLELAGFAPSAAIALQKAEQSSIDIVVLDVEMPEMNGIEAAAEFRKRYPRLPILMCSALTSRGARATLDALAAGATEYLAKPSGLDGGQAREAFRHDFVLKLKTLTSTASTASSLPAKGSLASASVSLLRRLPRVRRLPEVIAIGCSTGGPVALNTVFSKLPGNLPVPLVVVQHMPPLFTKMLADRLSASTPVQTHEARSGEEILPGHAYLAPGGSHLTFVREGERVRAVLNQEPPENSCRPAVDVLFRGAARAWNGNVLAAVLTGMGRDGASGAAAIVEAGGTVLVQDPRTCVVPTMPLSVVNAGLATEALGLHELAAALVTGVARPLLAAGGARP